MAYILVYPNPGNDFVCFRTMEKDLIVNLYDLNGKEVINTRLVDHITYISTADLNSGSYFYEVSKTGRIVDAGKWIKN